jgi:xanthine dehydrogenase molybdopterin-binding subunit B
MPANKLPKVSWRVTVTQRRVGGGLGGEGQALSRIRNCRQPHSAMSSAAAV